MATINDLQDEVVEEFQDFHRLDGQVSDAHRLGQRVGSSRREIQERAEPYRRLSEPCMVAVRLCRMASSYSQPIAMRLS